NRWRAGRRLNGAATGSLLLAPRARLGFALARSRDSGGWPTCRIRRAVLYGWRSVRNHRLARVPLAGGDCRVPRPHRPVDVVAPSDRHPIWRPDRRVGTASLLAPG